CRSLQPCATCCREHVQQSTGQDAPKQTNDGQGPSIASMPERIDNSSGPPENRDPVVIAITKLIISVPTIVRSRAIKSLWVGNGVALPAAEHRWWIGFRDL